MRETVKIFAFDQWGRIPLVHERGDPGWEHNDGKKPGWGMSGGGPEGTETPMQAATRETKEELGLYAKPKQELFSEPAGCNHKVTVFYSGIVDGVLQKESSETDDADWFFYDELPEVPGNKFQSIYPAERRRIKKAIEILGLKKELDYLKWLWQERQGEEASDGNGETAEVYQREPAG
ncbi:MAG: NUDIX domain-containing protein [Candidatus Brennerbacteria bacterium]|nr:NUDIX domain-containing protein [Candidatus Brennerbacteria bacterium]